VLFKKSVSRDLAKLGKEDARRIIRQVEKGLSTSPTSYPVLKGKFAGMRKYRVGSYRVIYTILGGNVLVLRMGHRREVYK
jgi:mRNA interferase RelE/StbE